MFHEYPSIIGSGKCPKAPCIAFDKLDGSNLRFKYSPKKGFFMYGTRTQSLDPSHPQLGEAVAIFNNQFAAPLTSIFKKEFPNEREITAYAEFFGPNSFAGVHVVGEPKELVLFDVLVGHKQPKFLLPQEFIKMFSGKVPIPKVIYSGNLNDSFIADVRAGKYPVKEGVICKGTSRSGAFAGGVWMAKIKTQAYLDSLKAKYGDEGLKKYGE